MKLNIYTIGELAPELFNEYGRGAILYQDESLLAYLHPNNLPSDCAEKLKTYDPRTEFCFYGRFPGLKAGFLTIAKLSGDLGKLRVGTPAPNKRLAAIHVKTLGFHSSSKKSFSQKNFYASEGKKKPKGFR